MAGKRPCCVCRKWFGPQARSGKQQRCCARPECRRERHRRACASWRKRYPDYDRELRLRQRVVRGPPVGEALNRDPLAEVSWEAARDAVGLEVAVIMEETGKVLVSWARDAVHAQGIEITRKLAKVMASSARDAIAVGAGPP
jgi:hypothetical protein